MVEDVSPPPVVSDPAAEAAIGSKKAEAAVNGHSNGHQVEEETADKETVKEGATTYGDLSKCFLCAAPATAQCDVCRLVGFCGDTHGRVHRPEAFCFPFMVEQRADRGRCLVAVRDIEPLELVLWDSAAAMGPRMGSSAVCLQCLKPPPPAKNETEAKKQRCADCGWPVCGPDCATGHAHKIECPVLAEAAQKSGGQSTFPESAPAAAPGEVNDSYRAIAPLRLLLVKSKLPELWERLSYLMDHNEERRRADPELWNSYQLHVNKFLMEKLGGAGVAAAAAFSDEDIDRAVGLLWTNCFACAQGGGQAIFPTFSFASHSCQPNCTHSVFPNRTLALQAKTAIAAGEEFTISYISTMQGLLKRRVKLRDKWFFECACARCRDPSELGSHASTHLCQVCRTRDGGGGGNSFVMSRDPLDPVAPWACSACGLLTPAAAINDIENRIAAQMQQIDNTSLVAFEEMHEAAGQELHPQHYLMLLLKRHLVGLYSSVLEKLAAEDLERVKTYCQTVEAAYQIIDPGYHRDRGTVLRALCEVEKLLAKKYIMARTETEEQFRARVQTCIRLFQEAQKCMVVRVKKDPLAAGAEGNGGDSALEKPLETVAEE